MRIKKTSQYIEGGASLSNVYGTSNKNGYTQEYLNAKQLTLTYDNNFTNSSSSAYRVGNILIVKIIGYLSTATANTDMTLFQVNNVSLLVGEPSVAQLGNATTRRTSISTDGTVKLTTVATTETGANNMIRGQIVAALTTD